MARICAQGRSRTQDELNTTTLHSTAEKKLCSKAACGYPKDEEHHVSSEEDFRGLQESERLPKARRTSLSSLISLITVCVARSRSGGRCGVWTRLAQRHRTLSNMVPKKVRVAGMHDSTVAKIGIASWQNIARCSEEFGFLLLAEVPATRQRSAELPNGISMLTSCDSGR